MKTNYYVQIGERISNQEEIKKLIATLDYFKSIVWVSDYEFFKIKDAIKNKANFDKLEKILKIKGLKVDKKEIKLKPTSIIGLVGMYDQDCLGTKAKGIPLDKKIEMIDELMEFYVLKKYYTDKQ